MNNVVLFLANGFEEIEALATVDILRRGGLNVKTASLNADKVSTSSHNISVMCDMHIDEVNAADFDIAICPGGMPGSTNLRDNAHVIEVMQKVQADSKKLVAAICAAPMVLDKAGILKGKSFVMYPGMNEEFAPSGNFIAGKLVAKDGNIITGAGAGATFKFALAILKHAKGKEAADKVSSAMLIK